MGHEHPHSLPTGNRREERYKAIRHVTLVGSVVDFVLAVLKMAFGVIANSAALIADGVHSLSDLITDFMVLFAAKHGSREADAAHPYGHGRFETLATVLLGLSLIIVAIGIAWDSIGRLFRPEELLQPGIWALLVAALSVALKEWIYHYTMRVAKRLKSNMLKANAWHSRSDAISSIVVVIGVAGTMAGLEYLDAIAAVVVGAMVAKIGWDLVRQSVYELVDTGLDPERIQLIRHEILSVGGVRELHMLRTRRMGGNALVDVHVIVDPTLSVSEGHYIGEKVRKRLIDEVEEVNDVMVHVDSEDDEKMRPSQNLPGRSWLRSQLEEVWEGMPLASHIERLTMHYLDGKLDLEICLPAAHWPQNEAEQQQLQALVDTAQALEMVRSVAVYMRAASSDAQK